MSSQRCFVVCTLPHVYLLLSFRFICASFTANGPCPVRKWTISGVGSWSISFLLQRSGYISCVHWPFSVSSHLLFHVSFRNSSSFLSFPSDILSFLLESLSCCVFIAFIAICKSSGAVSVTIYKLSTGVVEYALYILRTAFSSLWIAFLSLWIALTYIAWSNINQGIMCSPLRSCYDVLYNGSALYNNRILQKNVHELQMSPRSRFSVLRPFCRWIDYRWRTAC